MTKTIGIYSVQVVLGAIAIAVGYAKLSGAGLMVQQFQVLGLGHGFLFTAGTAEIVAGLCLLLPRGGILGAVLLSCVMVGAIRKPGKLEVVPTKPMATQRDLSLAYSPGVAVPVLAIAEDPSRPTTTPPGNMVAVISNGTPSSASAISARWPPSR
jgi:hypothetical protein